MVNDTVASKSQRLAHLASEASKKKQELRQKQIYQANINTRATLPQQKASVQDVDDFLRLMTESEELEFKTDDDDTLSKERDFFNRTDNLSAMGGMGGGQHHSASDGQSKGRWLTEQGSDQDKNRMDQTHKKSEKLTHLGPTSDLNKILGNNNLEIDNKSIDLSNWQVFEMQMSHLGLVRLSVKLDSHGMCVKFHILDQNNAEVFWENEESITRSLSHSLGKPVRIIRDEEH